MEKYKDSACGPIDRSLLFMQEDHISTSIWEGDDRLRFDVRQYTTCMDKWVLDDEQRHLLDSWGFGVFAHPQVVRQNDIALIRALVERWRPETNTFHFPFGEMTITLEDVYMLMGLPISGRALTFTDLATPQQYWLTQWEDLRLEKGPVRKKKSDKKKKKKKSKGREKSEREKMWSEKASAVSLYSLRETYKKKPKSKRPEYLEQDTRVYTRAYVFWIIGAILFPTSSRATVHPRYIQLLQKTDEIIDYAWGAGVLAYLYRELGKAAKKTSTSINGCVMLLQLWAYERLLPGRPVIARGLERVWPRARAWAEPVEGRRVNPHHHVRQYRGDFLNSSPQ